MSHFTEKPTLYALIADDDKIVGRMLTFALTKAGFVCKTATDGLHASALLNHKAYSLVITDLQMPNKNGHSLASEILLLEPRPVVMIHTAIDHPKITEDLIVRGVDDISFKPTNYETLAVRARALVEQRFEMMKAAEDKKEKEAREAKEALKKEIQEQAMELKRSFVKSVSDPE